MPVRLAETGKVVMEYQYQTDNFHRYEGKTAHGRRVIQYLPLRPGHEPSQNYTTIITIEEIVETTTLHPMEKVRQDNLKVADEAARRGSLMIKLLFEIAENTKPKVKRARATRS